MLAFLFAGQGAQYIGMGRDLCESFPESRAVFDKADEVLGFSLSKLCFSGPQEELVKTANCQPAILAVSIAALEAFRSKVKGQRSKATYVAGLSLGEYSALVAAEAISFADALYLVRRRGEFMEEASRKRKGKMLSVIGLDKDSVENIAQEAGVEIANLNCPGQIVLSGESANIDQAKILAEEHKAKMAVELEVSGAFHSSLMKEAGERLAKELEKIKINKPVIPLICNVTAKPTEFGDEIRENLIKQVAASVLWEDSMRFLLAQGVRDFVEFGPGKVLKGLMRRIEPQAQVTTIEKVEDIEKLLNG